MPKVTKAEVLAHREPHYEAIFEAIDVAYELTRISISEIERHEDSQIRLQKANPSRVAQYVAMFKGGKTDPPPVTVYQDGFAGFRIVDANHRIAMLRKVGVEEVWAYVLTGVTQTQAVWIGAALNGLNGVPLSAGEIKRGVEIGLALDYKPETIARTIGASVSKVNRVIRIKKFEKRASDLGVIVDGINDTMRDKFSALTDDAVFIAAINLQREAEMSSDEWSSPEYGLLKKLRDAASEKDRVTLLAEARDDREGAIRAVKAGKVPHLSPVLTIRNLLMSAEKAVTGVSMDNWVPQGKNAPEWTGRIESLRDHLNAVLGEIELMSA